MDTYLVLFFISLASIAFMIGMKMSRKMEMHDDDIIDDALTEMPYMDEIKYLTVKKMKEYGYVVLLSSIRMSMKSSRVVKRAGSEIGGIVKKTIWKGGTESDDPKEVSKFLQMITEYKQKVKKIKRKIREEEGMVE